MSLEVRIHTAVSEDPAFEPAALRALSEPGFARFSTMIRADSSEEARFWVELFLQGARFCCVSHARLGWEGGPILEPKTRDCLCGRLWPALYVVKPVPMVFFPQVRIQIPGSWRTVDVNVATPQGFFVVEINGGGHRGKRDAERSVELDMRVVFLTAEDLASADLVGLILERFHADDLDC